MPWTTGDALVDADLVDVRRESDARCPPAPAGALIDEALGADRSALSRASTVVDRSTLQQPASAPLPDKCRLTRRSRTADLDRDVLRQRARAQAVGALATNIRSPPRSSSAPRNCWTGWATTERVGMVRTRTFNSPARIAPQPRWSALTCALQVDLFATRPTPRINATSLRLEDQTDFIVGVHSAGGAGVHRAAVWHPKADCSTIVPLVDER